ncbi:phosphoglycerate kinase [Jannaschia rubra]|uniref:phosphoglycerate kinase n=1 Tax=Jannaschia rubra TaxID=282197 RepID=UPI002493CEA3|nr:phosphoglycerate kinase [Jannaschia rubra]
MGFRTLDDMELSGKVVLTRVDINVPVENGRVTDTTRIDRIVPTVRDLRAAGARVVLLAHFGRPKGKVVPEMSLKQVVPSLSDALGVEVGFADGNYGQAVSGMEDGDVLLFENVRFNPGEESDDEGFARRLAGLGDVYCNDAFSAAHRAHATTHALARMLPACAGRSMEAELKALEAALGSPRPPVAAVVGGAKVSSKLDLLANLVTKVQHLIIGGGMANTFLAAQGVDVQKSLCEHDLLDTARDIAARAEQAGCTILLPRDVVVAQEFRANPETRTVKAEEVPEGWMILDAGPDSVMHIRTVLDGCATLVWNGPLGAFEMEPFDRATTAAAQHAAKLTRDGALVSVAGGGDTVAALNHAGVAEDFTYISTAGGAFLEWMEGKELPGVAALSA